MDLIAWSRNTFKNTQGRINSKQGELEELMAVGYGDNLVRINKARRELNELLHHEEVFWWQRSRSIWLSTRDKNTKFFHQQHQKNTIEGIHNTNGEWCTNIEGIATTAEEYYKRLFTASNNLSMDGVLDVVDRVATGGMVESLVCPYTEEEVRVALFQMHPSKSPGPKGMSSFFFQIY